MGHEILSWHDWVDLGLKKGLWIPEKYIFIFLVAKSTPIDYAIDVNVYIDTFLSFIWVSAAGIWLLLAGLMCKFYAGIFDH